MVRDVDERVFFGEYDLAAARKHGTDKEPASHQKEAIDRLNAWYDKKRRPEAGGILVLPTGGGKTFTAVRFLCRRALSDGYKVLWLAHTHHLLEQAFREMGDCVSLIGEPRANLSVRVVSGTPGHYPVSRIRPSDHVIIGTLQTVGAALKHNHPDLLRFVDSARGKLFVVFDEAHHSPAPSYRKLVLSLRERCSDMYLLGLTATPTYTDEGKKGWLAKLFPQGIIHQVTPHALMAAGVLAKPVFEEPNTSFSPDFDEREYQMWLGSHRDLPENIVTSLALNKDRNRFIADYYADNKQRFGKTIMFADRWYQCEQISECLRKRGVTTGTIYSHIDADPGSADARNKRKADDNAIALQHFRAGKLNVLLNVRMLTEGTDVPDVQSVFLTRATTSEILLTQMVGRALRGPKFGGTKEAYIVSFIDNWKHLINWAQYDGLAAGPVDDQDHEYGKRPPIHLISIDLVQRLARQMDSGINMAPAPFKTLLPVGWYRVEYQARVLDSDDIEPVRELVMVFEHERECFNSFTTFLDRASGNVLRPFEPESVSREEIEKALVKWRSQFFSNGDDHFGSDLLGDLLKIARHRAQNGSLPRFFSFAERDHHDLDAIALDIVKNGIGPMAVDQLLGREYGRNDRLWSTIYYRYDLFKSQLDACVNRILHAVRHGDPAQSHPPQPVRLPDDEVLVGTEPSEDLKQQVKKRDNFRCRCCDSDSKKSLQVDHICPHYYGGGNAMDNLQTLCKECNSFKGKRTIDFLHLTSGKLAEKPSRFDLPKPPTGPKARDLEQWRRYVFRCVNMFFQCAATHKVLIGKKGKYFYNWHVALNKGNDPEWAVELLRNVLKCVRRERKEAGYQVPSTITVRAPDHNEIAVRLERYSWPR